MTCAQHSQSTILNPKQFPTAGMNYFNTSTGCTTNTSSHTEINQNQRVHITEYQPLTQLKRIICQQQCSETSADSVYHSNTICLLIDNFAVIVKPPWNPNCIQKFKKICKNIMTYYTCSSSHTYAKLEDQLSRGRLFSETICLDTNHNQTGNLVSKALAEFSNE